MPFRVTGKLPSGTHAQRLKQSPNFKGTGFQNLSPTPMMSKDASYWKMTRDFFKKRPNSAPSSPLPSVMTDLAKLDPVKPVIVWFGHSSYFISIQNKMILIDPVFSGNASPVSFMLKSFRGSDVYSVDNLPPIDILIITHDHYDHLDYKTIRQLVGKVGRVYCSLGISSHLLYWGMDAAVITEMDWWDRTEIAANLVLTAAPARHFSGRMFKRNQTLWSSFILESNNHKIYIGGDSGYDRHFKVIGDKYGPFDLAILEAGQYNPMWPLIHMMPEETVQAAVDLRAKLLLPVHWGKFALAMHEWNEPIKRVLKKALELEVEVVMPQIGEPLILGDRPTLVDWWDYPTSNALDRV